MPVKKEDQKEETKDTGASSEGKADTVELYRSASLA
jgi:hypothetical protein